MIDDFLDILNRLLAIDQDGVTKMVEQGRVNSTKMFNAQHEEIGKGIIFLSDKAYSYISMFAVINSVLAKTDKYNLICAVYDNDSGKIVRFSKYKEEKPLPQIDKEYKDLPKMDAG